MKPFLIKTLIAVFVADLGLVIWRVTDVPNNRKVLSTESFSELTPVPGMAATSFPTEKKTPTPSPQPSITCVPTLLPSPIPTVLSFPRYSQEEIHGFIDRFSDQYEVDPNVLRHIATCESGFNASSVNGPYVGLFQFGNSSWVNNRNLMGEDTNLDLRFNAEESVQTAAFIVSKGIKHIWPNCYP